MTKTVSVLATFVLAMILHPEVVQRAREELEGVVGTDRLPSYSDQSNLPYVESIMVEVLRLRPPVSTGERVRKISL